MDAHEARTILEEERGRGLAAIAAATLARRAGGREVLRARTQDPVRRGAARARLVRPRGPPGRGDARQRGPRRAAGGGRGASCRARGLPTSRVCWRPTGSTSRCPGRRPRPGSLHPLAVVERRIVEVFTRMGYQVVEGPEIEDDWHNFEALNIPPDHPARTMKDSLYVDVPGQAAAHRDVGGADPHDGDARIRRSTSCRPGGSTARRPPTRRTSRSSIRSSASRSTKGSRSPT